MIGALRHRDFALLWWGGLVSVAGDWMLVAVLPYVVYQRTGSTIATAAMTVAELLPGILLGSLSGVLVDRLDRRRVLVVCGVLQAVVVLGLLLVLVSPALLGAVYVVGALQSALSSFSLPAESSLVPTLVDDDLLVSANAFNALGNRIGRLAGLPLGPVVLALGGLDAVVVADALSFLVAAVLAALVRPRPGVAPERTDPGSREFLAEWREGLVPVRRDPSIRGLFLVLCLMTLGGTMLDPLAAPWVRDVLHRGDGVYALLMAVHAVAGIGGSVLLGVLGSRLSPRVLCGVGSTLSGLVLLVRFNVPVVGVVALLTVVNGVTAVGSTVGVDTLAQQRVPEALRGRVFGTLQAAIWAASLVGAVVGGVGAAALGVVAMLDVASVLVLAAGLVFLLAVPARDG